MALKYLTKLFLLAAVLGLAFGGQRRRNHHPRKPADCCRDKVNEIVVKKYTNKGVRSSNVKIVYNDDKIVDCGNCLSSLDVCNEPTITYNPPSSKPHSKFTIILFDPDECSETAPFLSWMVVNVQLQDICQGTLGNADTPVCYEPPVEEGHRYTFLIYLQTCDIDPQELQKYEDDRYNFPVKHFAKNYGLANPAVGQFFRLSTTLDKPPEPSKLLDILHPPPVLGMK